MPPLACVHAHGKTEHKTVTVPCQPEPYFLSMWQHIPMAGLALTETKKSHTACQYQRNIRIRTDDFSSTASRRDAKSIFTCQFDTNKKLDEQKARIARTFSKIKNASRNASLKYYGRKKQSHTKYMTDLVHLLPANRLKVLGKNQTHDWAEKHQCNLIFRTRFVSCCISWQRLWRW